MINRFIANTYHKTKYFIKVLQKKELYYSREIKIKKEFHGNHQAEWCIKSDSLNNTSIVYSFGVGTDISFDISLIKKYGCKVYAFDPTPRSIDWVKKQMLPNEFIFMDYGLYNSDTIIKFYPPKNVSHVSYSAIETKENDNAIELPVFKLKTIMAKLGHTTIDLLKMDIEGSEYIVVQDLLKSGIKIKQILIEFHHIMKDSDLVETKTAINSLRSLGFKIFNISAIGEEYSFINLEN